MKISEYLQTMSGLRGKLPAICLAKDFYHMESFFDRVVKIYDFDIGFVDISSGGYSYAENKVKFRFESFQSKHVLCFASFSEVYFSEKHCMAIINTSYHKPYYKEDTFLIRYDENFKKDFIHALVFSFKQITTNENQSKIADLLSTGDKNNIELALTLMHNTFKNASDI